MFTAKNNGTGSDEALIYTQVGFFDLCYAFRFNDHVDPTTLLHSSKYSNRLFVPRIVINPNHQLTE